MKARERTYIAIILALAVHAIVLLILHEFPRIHKIEQTFFAEVDLIEFPEIEEEAETHTLEELIAERIQQDVANLVADANSERTDQRSNFMSQAARDRIAKSVEGELKEFERQAFENAAERRSERATDTPPVDGDAGEGSAGNEAPLDKYDYLGKSYNGNVTAEYDVPGREARKLHIPGYKCKGGGVVKIDIVVNPTGEVIEAQINTAASAYSGECLPTEALNSARKSVFFVKSGSPKRMSGSITFRFIPQ